MAGGVGIVGIGQTSYRSRRDDVTYPELLREGVEAALTDAGVTLRDVDAFVFSMAPDALIGVSHAERWIIEAIGATGKPLLRVNTGGSTGISAVQTAYHHIACGMFDTVLVAGADRVGESGDAQTILNRIWDPFYERPLPLNTLTMLAFQAVRFMARYGTTEEHMALIAVKNRRNAMRNPYAHLRTPVTVEEVLTSRVIAWPIKLYDACPQSSGAAGMLLCSAERARYLGRRTAWIRGLAACAETYYMGDRMGPGVVHDHAESEALKEAARRACGMANIRDPAREIDVAELYAPFSNTELHAIQDVGLCERGEVGRLLAAGYFDLDGPMPVNPSGGVMCANPIAVTAMVRAAEAALQVTGRAGERQVEGARTALATGVGGDHQFFGTMVLSQEAET